MRRITLIHPAANEECACGENAVVRVEDGPDPEPFGVFSATRTEVLCEACAEELAIDVRDAGIAVPHAAAA